VLEPETGRIVFDTPKLLGEEELWTEDGGDDHAGWH